MTDIPLKIGMPTSTFLPALGGVEVGLHNIAMRLAARGHSPVVAVPARNLRDLRQVRNQLPYTLAAFPPKTMTLVHHWPDLGSRWIAACLSRLAHKNGIDIWHGTIGFPIGVALIRHAAGRTPHLVRCAGEDIQVAPEIGYGMRLNPRIDGLVRDWLPRADMLVAITDSVAAEYVKLGVAPDAIRHIPNGVDLERFAADGDRKATRRRHGIPEDAFMFLSVGRNHPKKGYDDLLKATRKLADRSNMSFAVVVAGAGTDALQSRAEDLAVADRLHLLGTMGSADAAINLQLPGDDLVDLYSAADAFVFPSHIETFGIALVEAMAAGLPVVTTNGPGCRDIVADGRWGEMVPVADPYALAEAMDRLMQDSKYRRSRAADAAMRAGDFSWDRVVDLYIETYRHIIEQTHNRERLTP